ncbi:MAG TPA: response regulator [Myxococcales bacterium]|jgi:two-component system chemotaxis response regulator CheY|nr:response regulator [Myxococcales bacterium]
MTPRKVLVVDDSKLLHRMYEVMLRQVVLLHAYDGQGGIDLLRKNPDIDLVLLDLNMPIMNGLEFLTVAKADPQLAKVPVIIVTTEGSDAQTKRGLEAGANAYLTKPFDATRLAHVIGSLESP